MNWSPQNEQGLLGLVAALKQGMDPTSAYSIFQNLQQDQASRMAARQQRLGGLAEMLMGAASQGMPYAGAEALAEAAPGPMGPAVENMMQALYPTAGESAPAAPMSASGQPIQAPAGYYDQLGPSGVTPMGTPNVGPQATSPTFQPDPMAEMQLQQAQMDVEAAAQEQAITADLTALQADAAAKKADGWTLDQFLAAAQKNNPTLFAAAPDAAKAVLEGTFGTSSYDMLGLQLPT